ncbi:MAG: hypothetical protein HEP71_25700 [Roseivirga sp.]|nr:hypothetical protein [Roseivirga sp.]
MEREILTLLEGVGFSPMESEVYLILHSHPDTTAYGIAQHLQKNRANVYKSLETLKRKQAAVSTSGSSIKWRAVPYSELLNRLESQHQSKTSNLRSLLAQVSTQSGKPNIYHFDHPDAVFSRVKEMLNNAKELILLDAFPDVLKTYRTAIAGAAQRGVHVALRTYAPFKPLSGVQVFPSEDWDLTESWNSIWLNLIVDGKEFVLSNLSANHSKVHHAYWSDDAYMAIVYGSALTSEMTLGAFIQEGITTKKYPSMIKTFTDLNQRLRNTSKYQQIRTV